jgi:hypothetical protein
MACCSSCYCTPCSCAPITGEADAPQCLPTGSELKLDSIGGFDEFNCPKALVPFRGFDAQGNAIINESVPYQIGFIQQDVQGRIFWTNRPEIPLAEDDIGIQLVGDQANPANSIPSLVGVDSDGVWSKVVARTGQTASTMKWYPTTGFTLETDPDDVGVCTTLATSLTLDPTISTYVLTIESSAVFTTGVSVMLDAREFVVAAVLSPTQIRVTPAFTISGVEVIIAGLSVCGIGFRPVSGITSSYVDTITGSLSGASASLTFPSDVSSQKVPGLFWRDQLGKVSFLAAPVDGSGVIVPNQILKTPSSPTAGAANIPTFVPAPGAYSWITPYEIPLFTFDVGSPSYGGPTTSPRVFNVTTTPGYLVGSKMVILDIRALLALQTTTTGGASVELTINGFYATYLNAGNSFGTATDTNQIIIPIPVDSNLTLSTIKIGTINNIYSQKIRVIGFIG